LRAGEAAYIKHNIFISLIQVMTSSPNEARPRINLVSLLLLSPRSLFMLQFCAGARNAQIVLKSAKEALAVHQSEKVFFRFTLGELIKKAD
jgi:hypothetical protein